MKKFLITAGIIIGAIIVIGGILIYANRGRIANFVFQKTFETMETAVIKDLPGSVSQDSVRTLFSNVRDKVKTGEVDRQKFQHLILTFQTDLKDKKLDSLEVVGIIDSLKKMGSE